MPRKAASTRAPTCCCSSTLPGPLRLATTAAQATPIEPYRLLPDAEGYRLEVRQSQEWRPVYSFDLQPQQFTDYQMANWFVSTYPGSRFVQLLIAARPAGTLRHALLDAELAQRAADGRVERRRLGSVAELRQVLAGQFGIDVPAGARMDAAFERVLARQP
jgi:N-hydroxyarylamine O-acetyltransferase